MTYGMSTEMHVTFSDALQRVRDALAAQGFGILTEIDVKETMKAKIGADVDNYVILGACNPPLAYQALEADPAVGLLLPCNVVVRTTDSTTITVDIIDPRIISQHATAPGVRQVADEAAEKLRAVLIDLDRAGAAA